MGHPTYFAARGNAVANSASAARSSIPSSPSPARTAAMTKSPS